MPSGTTGYGNTRAAAIQSRTRPTATECATTPILDAVLPLDPLVPICLMSSRAPRPVGLRLYGRGLRPTAEPSTYAGLQRPSRALRWTSYVAGSGRRVVVV